MATAACELTWLSYLFPDLEIPLPTAPTLYCDSTSALNLTVKPVLHSRWKHTQLDSRFIWEKVAVKLVETAHIPTNEQIAQICWD